MTKIAAEPDGLLAAHLVELAAASVAAVAHAAGLEHALPDFHPDLVAPLDLMPGACVVLAADALVALARERDARRAPVLRPRHNAFEHFASRFPFTLTEDQAEAVEAALGDLSSGRPMDRLVCGDVGYGKTEVALRAAAAVLAGKQVALVAPITVLVRQHLETFRRRFAGMGVRIEQLSRLSSVAEARETRAGLADGSVRIAVGTQALAAKGVRFAELGLLIVDEEQRFGARQKETLRRLGENVHVMALTATPIPRTLEAALVGLQDLSVIATPPARRQPIRTVHVPLDDAVLRQSLPRCRRLGIAELKAGPSAAAAAFRDAAPPARPSLEARNERLILRRESRGPAEVLATAAELFDHLTPQRRSSGRSGVAQATA